jgi:hypothetical protein
MRLGPLKRLPGDPINRQRCPERLYNLWRGLLLMRSPLLVVLPIHSVLVLGNAGLLRECELFFMVVHFPKEIKAVADLLSILSRLPQLPFLTPYAFLKCL